MKQIKSAMLAVTLAAGLSAGVAATANAGDYSGNFMVRAGVSVVHPQDDVNSLTLGAVDLKAAGGDADISTEVIPSLTLSYFFTKNIAAELFCCFAKHQIEAEGAIAGLGEIGDFWIFPPAVTLQYHFDSMGGFKPYLGAGVQYIHFFKEESNLGSMDIDDAWGFVLQAGVDVEMGSGWYLNADVKKSFLDTEATWNATGLGTIRADVDVDPWIFSANLGYRFNLFAPRSAPMEPLK